MTFTAFSQVITASLSRNAFRFFFWFPSWKPWIASVLTVFVSTFVGDFGLELSCKRAARL